MGADVQRQRGRGLEEHERLWAGGKTAAGADLHGCGKSDGAVRRVECRRSGTFTKFAGNPVIKQITGGNRDPKVFWHEPTQKWVMLLYVETPEKKHTIHFFTSPNLRDWTLASVTEAHERDELPFRVSGLF